MEDVPPAQHRRSVPVRVGVGRLLHLDLRHLDHLAHAPLGSQPERDPHGRRARTSGAVGGRSVRPLDRGCRVGFGDHGLVGTRRSTVVGTGLHRRRAPRGLHRRQHQRIPGGEDQDRLVHRHAGHEFDPHRLRRVAFQQPLAPRFPRLVQEPVQRIRVGPQQDGAVRTRSGRSLVVRVRAQRARPLPVRHRWCARGGPTGRSADRPLRVGFARRVVDVRRHGRRAAGIAVRVEPGPIGSALPVARFRRRFPRFDAVQAPLQRVGCGHFGVCAPIRRQGTAIGRRRLHLDRSAVLRNRPRGGRRLLVVPQACARRPTSLVAS